MSCYGEKRGSPTCAFPIQADAEGPYVSGMSYREWLIGKTLEGTALPLDKVQGMYYALAVESTVRSAIAIADHVIARLKAEADKAQK